VKVLTKNTKIENFGKIYNKLARPLLIGLCLLALGGLYASAASAQASNVYITPDGGGNGICTNNAHPPSWFNNSGNWGNGSTQIGPGTIVHLCGTFVGSQGTTMLTAHGSGTNGNPIRLLFEQGTHLTSPAWPKFGAINISGQSYIVVDGGNTCGWVNNTTVPCNGTIQNTDAGTNLGTHPGGFASNGIYAGDNNYSSCSPGCRVTNLNIINLYVHASPTDTSADQQVINAITAWPAAGFRFDHNVVHDAGWAVNMWGNNQEIDHNDIYNVDHGTASGIYNGDISGMLIHDNHIHDFANWDTVSNSYHHDGIHIWASNHADTNRNHMVYNNLFDGDCGKNVTSWFFIEDNSDGIKAFNNVFVLPNNPNRTMAGEIAWGGGTDTNPVIVNNTFLGLAGGSSGVDLNGYHGATLKNNLFAGTNTFTYLWGGTTISTADYNQYEAQGAGGSAAWQYGAASINTNDFATWRAGLPGGSGQDAHSHYYSTSSVNSDGTLKPGSPATGAGTNLTSLGIAALNSDKSGAARPSNGSWTIGAYGVGTSTTPTVPSPPSNLKAVVQ
jgi:hypothetical protein